MFQRIVCFKFTAAATDADIQTHMDAFAVLKDAVPPIAGYSGGRAISGDRGQPPEYDSLHYLTFASLEDIDRYFEHPAHQQFIADHKHLWARVLVLNADIEAGPV